MRIKERFKTRNNYKVMKKLILFIFPLLVFSESFAQIADNKVNNEINLIQSSVLSPQGYLGSKYTASFEKRLLRLDLESILEPYRNRPGVQPWVGEHIGKFLHASVLVYKNTRNTKLKKRIDYAANELIKTQLPNGYLGTYLEEDRWTSWDVWSHKYNLIGLLSYYDLTKDAKALDACEKMADLMIEIFGEGKKDIVATGDHVGMASTSVLEPMVNMYSHIQKEEYLHFCNYLVNSWE